MKNYSIYGGWPIWQEIEQYKDAYKWDLEPRIYMKLVFLLLLWQNYQVVAYDNLENNISDYWLINLNDENEKNIYFKMLNIDINDNEIPEIWFSRAEEWKKLTDNIYKDNLESNNKDVRMTFSTSKDRRELIKKFAKEHGYRCPGDFIEDTVLQAIENDGQVIIFDRKDYDFWKEKEKIGL